MKIIIYDECFYNSKKNDKKIVNVDLVDMKPWKSALAKNASAVSQTTWALLAKIGN